MMGWLGGAVDVTHVSGQQLLSVIDAGHGNLPLTDQGEVVRVGGDEEHLWEGRSMLAIFFFVLLTVDE